MPNDGKHIHSKNWDSCFEKLKAQGKEPDSAAAICTASVGESLRYVREGETYFYVAADYNLMEVTVGEIPPQTPVLNLQEAIKSPRYKSLKALREAESLDEQLAEIRGAFQNQFGANPSVVTPNSLGLWVERVYDDFVIVKGGEEYFKIGYSQDDDMIIFDEREDWEKVEQDWKPETESDKGNKSNLTEAVPPQFQAKKKEDNPNDHPEPDADDSGGESDNDADNAQEEQQNPNETTAPQGERISQHDHEHTHGDLTHTHPHEHPSLLLDEHAQAMHEHMHQEQAPQPEMNPAVPTPINGQQPVIQQNAAPMPGQQVPPAQNPAAKVANPSPANNPPAKQPAQQDNNQPEADHYHDENGNAVYKKKSSVPPFQQAKEALGTSEMPATMQAAIEPAMSAGKENPDKPETTSHSHPHYHDGVEHEHSHSHEAASDLASEMDCVNHIDHTHSENPKTPAQKVGAESNRSKPRYWAEYVPLTESVVDREHKIVEVTLIRPGWSKNGRYYSKEVLRQSVPVFEGSRAFIDHPSMSDEKNRPERSVRDIAGYYTDVRQSDDGSLKASLHLVGRNGEEIFPLVEEAINNKPDLVETSINAFGKTRTGQAEGRTGMLVEGIVKAMGTDIVTTASAGGRFERLMQSGDEFTELLLKNLEYTEWREARPDYVARIKTEMRTARKEELDNTSLREAEQLRQQLTESTSQVKAAKDLAAKQLAEKDKEVTRLTKELSDLRESVSRRESVSLAERKLAESKLPEQWKEDVRLLLVGKSEAEMDKVLESERRKWLAIKQPVKVKEAGAESLTSESLPVGAGRSTLLASVTEALGVDVSDLPIEGESPEMWARRTNRAR